MRTYLESADGDRSLPYIDLADAVATWDARLTLEGVPAGAMVSLGVSEPIAFATAFLAIIAGGRWVIPQDPAAVELQPRQSLNAAARLGAALHIGDRPPAGSTPIPFLPLVNITSPCDVEVDQSMMGHGGVILSSSGTTGDPKVMALTEFQLLYTARQVAIHHELSAEDRGFNPLPLFHINAEVVGLLATLVAGATLVLDDRFHRTGFWDVMRQRRVTWINAVPAIVTLLADVGPAEEVPSGIRFTRSASAPLPAHTMTTFEARTGIPVLETYGMTEAASQITANPLRGVRKPGSVGLPVGVDLRLTSDGVVVDHGSAGTVGQVEIRGASVISRYGPPGSAHTGASEGWLPTGDLGYLDHDGYLFLVGRQDDVINRGGEKILPRPIEESLLADRGVAAVAVVGMNDAVLGQVPVAFVVVAEQVQAAEVAERVRAHLTSTLVRHRRPAQVRVVAALPAGPNGKVRRRLLRSDPPPSIVCLECR
jgi:acyl-CoA synthetase (AMP-forming)/AMP-acid ligase II